MRRIVLVGAIALAGILLAAGASGSSGSGQARWTIRDLGSLGGGSQANAINEKGQIVGMSGIGVRTATGGEIEHAFLWQKGRMVDLGTLGTGFNATHASAINGSGQIIGSSEKIVPVGNTEGTVRSRSFLWAQGRMTDLGSFGGKKTEAWAINERGQVVGRSATPSGINCAFLWQRERMTSLGTFAAKESAATTINNRGQIVGEAFSPPRSAFLWAKGKVVRLPLSGPLRMNERTEIIGLGPGGNHVFLWRKGKTTDLGSLNGEQSLPVAINERGQIIGTSGLSSFLWWSGRLTDLGTLGGEWTTARAINERGQVVGRSATNRGSDHAFLWQNGKMLDLGTLPGGRYSEAVAINDQGQIVGTSQTRSNATHAVLWTLRSG